MSCFVSLSLFLRICYINKHGIRDVNNNNSRRGRKQCSMHYTCTERVILQMEPKSVLISKLQMLVGVYRFLGSLLSLIPCTIFLSIGLLFFIKRFARFNSKACSLCPPKFPFYKRKAKKTSLVFHEQKLNNNEEQLKELESLVDQSFLQNEDLSV